MRFTSRLSAVALWGVLGAMSVPAPAFGQGTDASLQANTLFDEYWQWVLREYPDFATLYFGDHSYPDRLRDESAAAVFGRTAAVATFRKRSDQIDAALLSPQERVSLRMLQFRLDAALAINKAHGSLPFGVFDPWAPVTQMGGLHLDLPQLAKAARFRSVSRLRGVAEAPRRGAWQCLATDRAHADCNGCRLDATEGRDIGSTRAARSAAGGRCAKESASTSRSSPFRRTWRPPSNRGSRLPASASFATR